MWSQNNTYTLYIFHQSINKENIPQIYTQQPPCHIRHRQSLFHSDLYVFTFQSEDPAIIIYKQFLSQNNESSTSLSQCLDDNQILEKTNHFYLPDSNGFYLIDNSKELQLESLYLQKINSVKPKKCMNEELDITELHPVKIIKQKFGICTDLGGTLYPPGGKSLLEFNSLFVKNYIVQREYGQKNLLIYCTGRWIGSVLDMIQVGSVIRPDFIIARCGCQIYIQQPQALNMKDVYVQDLEWQQIVDNKPGWNSLLIQEKLSQIEGLQLKQNRKGIVGNLKFLCQKDIWQNVKEQFHIVVAELENQNFKFEKIVRDKEKIINIEILPKDIDKGKALQFLLQKYGNGLDINDITTFGDSMNDKSILEIAGQGIAVKNSRIDLLEMYNKNQFKNVQISEFEYSEAHLNYLKQKLNIN